MERKIPLARVGEIMKTVLSELKALGGQARLKDILDRAEPKLRLIPYELQPYAKSGYIRWRAIVHFYSIGSVKVGYIQKLNGKWSLTAEGEHALKYEPEQFIRSTIEKYRAWKSQRLSDEPELQHEPEQNEEQIVRQTAYDQASEQARAEIEEHINGHLGPTIFKSSWQNCSSRWAITFHWLRLQEETVALISSRIKTHWESPRPASRSRSNIAIRSSPCEKSVNLRPY